MIARFDLDDQFWNDFWTQWLLYGTVYAINNPKPRVVEPDEFIVTTRETMQRWFEEWQPHDPTPDRIKSNCTSSVPCEVHRALGVRWGDMIETRTHE